MNVQLETITPNAEVNIVKIARVSSPRKDKTEKPEKLIKYLIDHKHWSPFQHAYMTVGITTSKAISIQILRHLSFTFQEFSQRYATVPGWEPFVLRLQAESNRQSSTVECDPKVHFNMYIDDVNNIDTGFLEGLPASQIIEAYINAGFDLYNKLLAAGVARESARFVLPLCTSTDLYVTGSIRSWIHYLAIRDDEHTQLEHQLIAQEIKEIFIKELPLVSKALGYIE